MDTTPSGEDLRRNQLEQEQRYTDLVYARVDSIRSQHRAELARVKATDAGGTHQNRSERDSFAHYHQAQIGLLDSVENQLVFGRLDGEDGRGQYIGRIGVSDENRKQLLMDWRAPGASRFYQATPRQPRGVFRRRHLKTDMRTVVGIEDELLGRVPDDLRATTLVGEGALMAALSRARGAKMSDIVQTIQAEQDTVVRAPVDGILAVSGGPGTGKTAVALHRIAYLLYTHRERLEKTGVLIVGPSPMFLRYIEEVLPSLGESGVVSVTPESLLPGYEATGVDSAPLARLKGDWRMLAVLRAAVADLARMPAQKPVFRVDGVRVAVKKRWFREAFARARETSKPHNLARNTYVQNLLSRISKHLLEGPNPMGRTRREFEALLREDPLVRRTVNLAWLPTSAGQLLERLWARPDLLERYASDLDDGERGLLLRERGKPWTRGDIALLDELEELLGPLPERRIRRVSNTEVTETEYAQRAITSMGLGGGLVSASQLASRYGQEATTGSVAERASRDRGWSFGHIVVDEAQEITAMMWRLLARRCPSLSMTLVGDLAQKSGEPGPQRWEQLLPQGARKHLSQKTLTVSYRTPATVMDGAGRAIAALGHPSPTPVTAVRDLEGCLLVSTRTDPCASATEIVALEAQRLDGDSGRGAGRIAVIAHPDNTARLRRELEASEHREELSSDYDQLDKRISIMTPEQAKGLEFDTVILLEPADIARLGPGDLYVAMTRCTRRLHLLHESPLPRGIIENS